MTNSTQEYLVKRKAFMEEFEKLGGYGLLGKLITKLMSKSTIAKDIVGKVSTFASKHSDLATNPALYTKPGSEIYQKGMETLKTTSGKSSVRPLLGKSRQPLGFRESKKIPFKKDPVRRIGQMALTGAANLAMTGKTIAKKGIGKYLKEDLARTQYFTKTIGSKGGKQYDYIAKRSLPGRLMNPVFDTGIGFGGLALATNKYDEQGQKRGIADRVGGAAKEAIAWGPLRPLAMAHMTTVELPKITKDLIKGF
jgi:hypothetical protein